MGFSWRVIRRWVMSRRFGFFLTLMGFVWGISIINISLATYSNEKSSEELQDEILQLSERYVKSLAQETRDVIDGPYAGRQTGYDLKKTLAVLLENLLDRIGNLEKKMDVVLNSSSSHALESSLPVNVYHGDTKQQNKSQAETSEAPIDAKDLLLGAQENCTLSNSDVTNFPHCQGKINWMRVHWKSDPCYAKFGVDGTDCSFRYYLSEVEHWCPLLVGRQKQVVNHTAVNTQYKKASLNFDLSGLLAKLQDPGQRRTYDWMRMRIERMWPNWVAAGHSLATQQDMGKHMEKRILVHLGLLSKKSGFKIAESSFKGGPLGELVQWSDIISALYLLGHELTITSEVEQLAAIIGKLPTAESQCQNRDALPIDMIFTDIVGLTQFKRKVRSGYGKFSCLLRIIDSFGTEPAFNFDVFAKAHRLKTQWGMQNLDPRQFYTMFPHSPDNSFMGFVVEQHLNKSELGETWERRPQGVVYGKAEYMWTGKNKYLEIIKKYVDIHGTVFIEKGADSSLPPFVKNHGILSGPELHKLLRESKLFIGLGFPYEGPAPLEAIAQGNVFINPKFNPPHNSENTKFFKGKPTKRKLTSQHPYAEEFIREPHVYTVDMDNTEQVEAAIKSALTAIDEGKVSPLMPYEYQEEGMLQRLTAYIANQDFCDPHPKLWPPEDQVTVILGQAGHSCKDTCRLKDLICEPGHFKMINKETVLQSHLGSSTCAHTLKLEDIYFPAFRSDTGQCVLQQQPLLFSCVGEQPELQRLCPCRTYIRGQTALCKTCTT